MNFLCANSKMKFKCLHIHQFTWESTILYMYFIWTKTASIAWNSKIDKRTHQSNRSNRNQFEWFNRFGSMNGFFGCCRFTKFHFGFRSFRAKIVFTVIISFTADITEYVERWTIETIVGHLSFRILIMFQNKKKTNWITQNNRPVMGKSIRRLKNEKQQFHN